MLLWLRANTKYRWRRNSRYYKDEVWGSAGAHEITVEVVSIHFSHPNDAAIFKTFWG